MAVQAPINPSRLLKAHAMTVFSLACGNDPRKELDLHAIDDSHCWHGPLREISTVL
jgi:hypothetical protein